MKQGDIVLVHLSDAQLNALHGNKLSPMPAIVVTIWENEFPTHPKDKTGINVRVFTDSDDSPLWLTSLPMNFDGVKEMYGQGIATYELILQEVHPFDVVFK